MIVTSIGERCFLQNWLWKQHQDGVLEYHENTLSSLQEYPYPSKYPVNITPDKLSRYDDFCKSFQETCKEEDISGHKWLVSKEEGCMTHYIKNINWKDRQECFKHADVVLYTQMFKHPGVTPDELAEKMMEYTKKVNPNDPKFVMFSPFAEGSSSPTSGCYVLRIDECPYWDLKSWEKSNKKETPDPEYEYLKGWHVKPHDVEMIENVLSALK